MQPEYLISCSQESASVNCTVAAESSSCLPTHVPHITFHTVLLFCNIKLLTTCTTLNVQDHPLLAVLNEFLKMLTATCHVDTGPIKHTMSSKYSQIRAD